MSQASTSFGGWVKHRRRMLDLTQEDLAQRAGCSVFTLRKIESGERRPSKQLAGLLAETLEIHPDDRQAFVRVARGEQNLERLRSPSPGLESDFMSLASGAQAPLASNLPLQLAPIVGRQPELAALARIFNDPQCRLLTLTGLGGMGKTRLAVEFASSHHAMFPGGVVYVPLASLQSPDLIVPAIADVLGLTFSGPAGAKAQLLNFMAAQMKQASLLLLDNLEHLLLPCSECGKQAVAVDLVMEILHRLPNIRILVTSRERLNLRGEWVYELHGLPGPPPGYTGSLENYAAAALFLQSACRARPDFQANAEERQALIHICHLLDGIPLAIELAATWVRLLSSQEIAAEIETNLDILTTTMRDVPARHSSIRATFDHSWKLLAEEECCVLRQLAVFHGGFSRAAAAKICSASLASLDSLQSKSLIRRLGDGRYDLHEVIRQYLQAFLADDEQRIHIHDRHCDYYLTLLRDREGTLKSPAQQSVIRELAIEMDNIRAAWSWAVERRKFAILGQALRSFGWLCDIAGWLEDGIEQLDLFIAALRSEESVASHQRILGHALTQHGLLCFRKGYFARAQASYAESLAILRSLDEMDWLTDPLVFSGIITHMLGDLDRARLLVEEGLACARASENHWLAAYAVYNLGYIDSLLGRYAAGYEQMQAGMAIWREIGDPSSIALGLNYISPTAIQLGFLDHAQAYLQESLHLCQQIGDRWSMGTAYRNLGLVAIARRDPLEAQRHIRKSLEVFGGYIVGWDIARSLTYLGDAVLMAGDCSEAQRLYLDAFRIAVEIQAIPIALDAILGFSRLRLGAGDVSQAFELARFVLSHPAGTQQIRDQAVQLVSDSEALLGCQRIQALSAGSNQQSLDTIFTILCSAN